MWNKGNPASVVASNVAVAAVSLSNTAHLNGFNIYSTFAAEVGCTDLHVFHRSYFTMIIHELHSTFAF